MASVLQELGLSHLSSACVGAGSESAAGARGISGGERRRVSIGMELVTEPALIIMDGELLLTDQCFVFRRFSGFSMFLGPPRVFSSMIRLILYYL